MSPSNPDLAARLDADIAAHGRPPARTAGMARTVAAVKAALAGEVPAVLPFAPPADEDDIEIIPCTCGQVTCAECGPRPGPAQPEALADLLAAAEAALPVLGALGNRAVRPVFNALWDAVQKAKGLR